jgi:hypothetical protein
VRSFWPPAEAAQTDYEQLRASELAGVPLASPSALRFAKGGLAAVVGHPTSEPVFSGIVLGGKRPSWSPYADPRLEVLVACYELVLGVSASNTNIVNEEAAE